MIILNDNTLAHVDSYVDVIEHYGVKGMKWGVHRRADKLLSKFNKNVIKEIKSNGYEFPDDIMKDYTRDIYKLKNTNPNYKDSDIKVLSKNIDKRFKDFDRRSKSAEKKVKKSSNEYKNIDAIRELKINDTMAKHRYNLDRMDLLSGSKAYRGFANASKNIFNYGTLATAASSVADGSKGFKNTAIVGGGTIAGGLATYSVAKGIDAYKTRKIRKRLKQTRNEIKDKLRNYV